MDDFRDQLPREDSNGNSIVDFRVHNHGSILILFADSKPAKEWVAEHIPDDALTWGINGTVVEPRYIGAIVDGIIGDGLNVEGY
jgi:hypothetical protein